jgi:hypothetical protein
VSFSDLEIGAGDGDRTRTLMEKERVHLLGHRVITPGDQLRELKNDPR